MPFHYVPEEELRSICKKQLESLELWLRRLIDEKFTEAYGLNYFYEEDSNGNNVIKKAIREKVEERKNKEPLRYPRLIDATLLDNLIDIICNQSHYKNFFRDAFMEAFPLGCNETRIFLERLVQPRNHLSHSNPLSIRQAEQVICYCHDIIESFKTHYKKVGKMMNYNVPTIIRITDSFGNVFNASQINRNSTGRGICDLSTNEICFLRPGDILSIEVVVDPNFAESNYKIQWVFSNQDKTYEGKNIRIEISDNHVREDFVVYCNVISDNEWHRCGDCDDSVGFIYKVLPLQI